MTRPLAGAVRQLGHAATAWRELTDSRYGPGRVLNAVIAKTQAKIGMTYLFAMPGYIAIEVTNLCDGGCLLCPVGQGRRGRPFGRMPWDRFCRIVDEVTGYARFVGLYNWGEPFLHLRIYDMIRHVTARRIFTKLSSNLYAFRVEDAEELVRTGLNDLAVSLHGLSEASYRAYQPRHHFDEVIEKVKALVVAKRRLGSQTPDIHLGFIVTRYNEHEASALPEFADSLGVGYLLSETSLNLRLLPYDRDMNRRDIDEAGLREERLSLIRQWLPQEDSYISPYYRSVRDHGGELPPAGQVWLKCLTPWNQVIICWDGDVNLCCGSYDRRHSVGNVFETPLRKIWNGPLYRAARRAIAGRRRASDIEVLCHECPGMLL